MISFIVSPLLLYEMNAIQHTPNQPPLENGGNCNNFIIVIIISNGMCVCFII